MRKEPFPSEIANNHVPLLEESKPTNGGDTRVPRATCCKRVILDDTFLLSFLLDKQEKKYIIDIFFLYLFVISLIGKKK